MKLLLKTNIYNVVTTIVLFSIGIVIVLNLILSKFDKEQGEQLLAAKTIIIKRLNDGKAPESFSSNIGEKIAIIEIPKQTLIENKFREYEEVFYEIGEGYEEYITVRELTFQCTIHQKSYQVSISKSLSEGKEIGEYIFGVVLVFVIITILVLFLLNRYISAYIFSPFYDTLSKIKNWNVKKNGTLSFEETNIDEFNLLNDTISALTQQIQKDYKNLKEFTENVSHETQTPLSIISTKIETLIQFNNYNEKQNESINQIYQATQRLYKLNQVLILMSRIENKQFIEIETVNLNDAISEKIIELEDFIEAKDISVVSQFNEKNSKNINATLFNILLNNLLINAIKYNKAIGGSILITLDEESFSIENTSDSLEIDKQFIFERFLKTSSSLGVGLSLIKKIVDFYNWQITYSYKNNKHKFKIYM